MARALNLVACALALTVFTAPAALADPPDVSTTISGTLERTHLDSADGPTPITVLSTATGPQVVTFAADQPVPPNGADVDLEGRLKGSTFVAREATVTGPTLALPASTAHAPLVAGTPRSVAIVVITFSNGYVPAYTDVQLQNVLTQNSNSVSNYYAEQSYGAVSFRGLDNAAGDVYRVSIASNGSGCASNAWQTWGSQAAAAVGATINRYDNVIYVFNSHGGCGFAGVAWMPGDEAYIDNAFTLPVVAHELGHNLGVHHAASLRCSSGGTPVSFSSANLACTPSEYGDPNDIMGSSQTNQQSAFHKLQSGWLGSSSGPRVQTITASGDYTVGPLEASSGVALLLVPHVTAGRVSDPNTTLGDTFALDFRQPYGTAFDAFSTSAPAVGGVQIRLVQAPGSGAPIQTQLIDATPQTSTFSDATLADDASFSDATDGVEIQTIDVNPLGATVRITLGASGGSTGVGTGVVPPDTSAPTSVTGLTAAIASGPVATLSFAAATDDRAVRSYSILRDGVQIDSLGAAGTSYADWTTTYGTHTYGVAAVDSSGNVGPTATTVAVVSPPVVPKPPTPTTAPPVSSTPGGGGSKPVRVKAKAKIVKLAHGKRRVLLAWKRVAGYSTYSVTRNGKRLRSTTSRTLIDRTPPRGTLRYAVTAVS